MPLDLSADTYDYSVRFCPEYPNLRAACVVSPDGLAAAVYGPQKGIRRVWDVCAQEGAEGKAGFSAGAFVEAMERAERQRNG